MKIKISPFAEEDLKNSIEFYNKKQDNLGDEFAEEVAETFERIKENQNQFPKAHKEIRKALVNRFPFNVLFVVKDAIGFVLGIFHTSRNPKTMKDRYKTME